MAWSKTARAKAAMARKAKKNRGAIIQGMMVFTKVNRRGNPTKSNKQRAVGVRRGAAMHRGARPRRKNVGF